MPVDDQPDAPAGVPRQGAHVPKWAAILRRNAPLSNSPGSALAQTLGQVIADLEHLNRHTEQDFLRIGGKLAEFIEAVNLISAELTALADWEHGQRASQALASALDLANQMTRGVHEGNSLLGSMRQEAERLKHTLAEFNQTVATFRTLGLLTRIETARLGSAGADFGTLAEDVRSLAGNVKARVESALETATLLIPPIESAMQSVSALEEGQGTDLPSVISGVQANLSTFRDIQKRVHDSSVRLGARYAAILDAFKKLIVSIQFHDITRQQVEHVIDVLRRLSSESEQEGGISHDGRDPAAILPLQSMQLAHAGEKFAASVVSVTRSLDDIARHVLEMAGESRTLSGLSEGKENSFFLQMELGCSTILASLSHCAAAEATTRVTSGALADMIGRMRGPVEEIQAIEIQVHYMALNARIRAAQLGASGDVLSILAASMQQLASDCRERSESLVTALGAMSEAAARLSGQGGPEAASEPGSQDGYLTGLRTAVLEMHSSTERSFALSSQIAARGAGLCEDLLATRRSFSVGALFAEAVSRARGMLKDIGEKNSSALSPDGAKALQRELADLARHYTMQAERDVHEGIAKAVAVAAPAAVQTALLESPHEEAGEAAELGENVEFF
jgi:hypothetical protein